jgi:hypothetical protein
MLGVLAQDGGRDRIVGETRGHRGSDGRGERIRANVAQVELAEARSVRERWSARGGRAARHRMTIAKCSRMEEALGVGRERVATGLDGLVRHDSEAAAVSELKEATRQGGFADACICSDEEEAAHVTTRPSRWVWRVALCLA